MQCMQLACKQPNIQHTVIKELAQRPTLPRSPPILDQQQVLCKSKSDGAYACMPSTASKVWYKNMPIAQLAYTHGGQSVSMPGLYHITVRKLSTTNRNPVRVI